jgi:hypothetical protein
VVSGTLDAQRQAFVDRTLEVILHSSNKVAAIVTFARVTLNIPLDRILRPRRRPQTAARWQHHPPQPHEPTRAPSLYTLPNRFPRNDGVAHRADSYPPASSFMRHRVRRRWRELELIGASGQVASWIRNGVRVELKQGLRPRPSNHGVSMLGATPS